MSIGVQDVLADIDRLCGAGRENVFAVGHTLLPADLQDGRGIEAGPLALRSREELDVLLKEARSGAADGSQPQGTENDKDAASIGAIRLTRTYTALAQRTLAADEPGHPTNGRFERLHRRVADLQSRSDSEAVKLQELGETVQQGS